MDYKNAGVDIEAGYKSVELMKEHVKKNNETGEYLADLADFPAHFPWQRSKRWKSRYCFPVQTDAEPR